MDFNGVRLLGLQYQNNYFGDLFHYATKRNITIEGSLFDVNNVSGVSAALWTGAGGLIGQDYSTITVNGVNLGSGRLLGLSFPPGQDLQEKVYNASLEVFLTGNLFNLTGSYYQGIDSSNYNLIDTFSENFSFSQASNDKTFVHEINVRMFSGGNALAAAKQLASNLRGANQITGLLSGYYHPNKKTYINEKINKVTNEYGITETYLVSKETGNYSLQLSHSLNLAEDGFIEVTENGSIRSLTGFGGALAGVNSEVEQSFGRCNEVFSAHAPSTLPLNSKILALSKQLNEFDRTINYAVSYSNNLALRTGFSWNYTQDIKKTQSVVNVTEQGEIRGWGRLPSEKFSAAKNGFDAQKAGIQGRAQSIYDTSATLLKKFRLVSSEVAYSELAGTVSYSYLFSNDPQFLNDPYIKKCNIVLNDTYPLRYFNSFQVANVAELNQKMNLRTLGSRILNMNLVGYRGVSLNNYLLQAKNRCNQYIPSGIDTFINQASYIFDSGNRTLNLNLGWTYTISGEILGNNV